jgi:hypothetical protein
VLRQAIDRGLSVELQYSPALLASDSRRIFMANARQLCAVAKNAKFVFIKIVYFNFKNTFILEE